MWAIKVFDDLEPGLMDRALALAEGWGAGVECALYGHRGMSPEVDARLRASFAGNPRHALGLHLSHARTSLFELSEQDWGQASMAAAWRVGGRPAPMLAPEEGEAELLSPGALRLAREAGWARGVGCPEAVVHMDRGNSEASARWLSRDPAELARACAPAIEAAFDLGLRLHLEKTYESRAWLDAFYEQVRAQGQASKFGFTFDLGHSRVWRREPLAGWMESIARLHGEGFGLHFHLHGNPGDADRHDTLSLAQSMGWLDPDPEWAPKGAVPVVAEIARLYEDHALLVLETGTEAAWENLGWVELAIRG